MAEKVRRRFRRRPQEERLPKSFSVCLGEPVKLLNDIATEELCREVFEATRTTERDRKWSLAALAGFWSKVTLRSPASLEQALEEEKAAGPAGMGAIPETSPQGFYYRCQTLSPRFFERLFERVVERLGALAPISFNRDLAGLLDVFPGVFVVDGSRLDRIARRLKVVQGRRAVVLPGAIAALYDPFRGVLKGLDFTADAAEYELGRAERLIEKIAVGSLVVADRLYAYAKVVARLEEQGVFLLSRPNDGVELKVVQTLDRRKIHGVSWEDYAVTAEGKNGKPEVRLRWIIRTEKREKREVVTSVLDPKMLSAEAAVELYARRWSVERVFFDLKRVVNLHKFYAANPNGVAMQVYAGAMVYTAMRVVQGRIAQTCRLAAEDLSPARLYPRVARLAERLAGYEIGIIDIREANPGVKLVIPDPMKHAFCQTKLEYLLVRRRTGRRIKRRYCRSRATWVSLAQIPAARRAFCSRN